MFKDRFKKLRESKGLTQSQMAEELEIGRASISNYELGTRTPDIDVLVKIAEYFRVTTDYLTGISNFENYQSQNCFSENEIQVLNTLDKEIAEQLINAINLQRSSLIELTEEKMNHESMEKFISATNLLTLFMVQIRNYQVTKKTELLDKFNVYTKNEKDTTKAFKDAILEFLNLPKAEMEAAHETLNNLNHTLKQILDETESQVNKKVVEEFFTLLDLKFDELETKNIDSKQ